MPLLTPLVVDLVVLAVVVLAALRGWRTGGVGPALRIAAALAGLLVGLWCARLLSASLSPVGHVVLGAVCAVGGLVVGSAIGRRLTAALRHGPPVVPDRVLGVVVRGGVALVCCGLLAGLVGAYGPASWSAAVRGSTLGPDSAADVPVAGEVWTGVARLVDAAAPADLAALLPATDLRAPDARTVAAVDERVRDSVLLVSVRRCGSGAVGTGFVVADGTVVTNAHVVSAADSVTVGGAAATVVRYDRRADLAVLHVPGLDAPALPLAATDADNGAGLVVVGYPGGGPRTAVPATVVQRMPVPNPGLADGASLHQAYRLRADIRHGNSGSPLLDTGGHVVGVVNALAGNDGDSGYAISLDELRTDLTAAAGRTAPVTTGSCT